MARLHIAFLLVIVAISAVIVSAADNKPPSTTTAATPPTATTPTDDVGVAEGPVGDDNAIGTTDDDAAATPGDDDVAVAGPIGSENANYPPPQPTSGSSATVAFGFVYVVAATAVSLFF